jgi:hypothetical protein
MNAHTFVAGIFLDPPVDAVARYPLAPLLISIALAVPAVIFGVLYTIRTRTPLYFWSALTGVTLVPCVVEPVGDWPIAVWYPTNNVPLGTFFGRDMPLYEWFFYLALIPVGVIVTWELIKHGTASKRLVQLIVLLVVAEVPLEILGNHFDWMVYYGNHALVAGVPIYCYVQNGGMIAPVALFLAVLMPRMKSWRWILFPPALAAWLIIYALVVTFPAYIAIHTGAGPAVGWAAGILAALMNIAGVLACIYSPPLRQLRGAAQQDQSARNSLPAHAS